MVFANVPTQLGLVLLLCASHVRGLKLRNEQTSGSGLPIPNAVEGEGVDGNAALASSFSKPNAAFSQNTASPIGSMPVGAQRQPIASQQEQHIASQQQQPIASQQQQPIASQQQQPIASQQQPPIASQPSAAGYPTGYQQPVAGYQQPAAGYQQPAAGYQQPAAGYQQPAAGYQQPPAAAPLVYNAKQPIKPNIDVVRHALLNFTPYVPNTEENCDKVSQDLQEANLFQQHIHFQNVLSNLAHNELEGHERIRLNSDVTKEFISLDHIMLDRDDTSGGADLHQFFSRISKCKIEQDTGRGILQKLMYLGLGQALKSPFGRLLLSGDSEHNPSYEADVEGNTLLHLAVMSGAVSLPRDLILEETKKHRGDKSRQSNGMFWALSCMDHRNLKGYTPVMLAKTDDVSTYLKGLYRTFSTFIKGKTNVRNRA